MSTIESPSTDRTEPSLTGATTMGDLLAAYPGAQRALFARYHIGGCQSCGFGPQETLAEVCARNEEIPVEEAIAHIRESASSDEKLLIGPRELAERMASDGGDCVVLDVRTREEHEAVALPGSRLMTQELIQEAFLNWDNETPVVLYDHTGSKVLDSVAYFIGHGFANARGLEGGIDAYSREVDKALPRYRVELD